MQELIEGLCTVFNFTSTEIGNAGAERAYRVSEMLMDDIVELPELCGSVFRVPILAATRLSRYHKLRVCDPESAALEKARVFAVARCPLCVAVYRK